MVDFTAHLGKYTKIKQLSRKISQFRQILVFTAKFLSLPLGGAAKFFTAKWQLNSANFSLFGGKFRSSGIAGVLPAPQGEEEGEDDDQALQICRAHHARGAALILFSCTLQILAQNFATY